MTDLSQMIRWNANFVRGLAQSVLERAKVIRGSLKPSQASSTTAMEDKAKSHTPDFSLSSKPAKSVKTSRKLTVKKAAKRPARKPAGKASKSKKTHG